MVMSELPYLKNKKNQGGGGPAIQVDRPSDDGSSNLIDMVADELMDAFTKKDRAALVHALRAFVLMIQDEDKEQDEGEMS